MADKAEYVEDSELSEATRKQKIAEANKATAEAEQARRLADPSTPEGKVEEKKRLAEAEKALGEAKAGAFAASYPRGTTQPLEGKVATDEKAGYFAELVGYRAMERCATSIAEAINGKLGNDAKVLIVDSTNVAQGDMPIEQVSRQMDLIDTELDIQKKRLESLLPPSPPEPKADVAAPEAPPADASPEVAALPLPLLIGGVTSVVGQMADLLSYFRTDYSVKGREFAVGDTALTAAIAGKISPAEAYVLNFNRLLPVSTGDTILGRFDALRQRRGEVDVMASEVVKTVISRASNAVAIAKARVQQLQARLTAAKDEEKPAVHDELDAAQTELARLVDELEANQAVVTAWMASSTAIDTRLGALLTPADASTPPLLLQAAAREQMTDMTHLLCVKVSSSGGESITRRSLWPFAWPEITYLGGGAVTYLLATKEGQIVAAGTATELDGVKHDLSKLSEAVSRQGAGASARGP